MKISVPVINKEGLKSEVDAKFGRANYFAVVDDGKEVEFIENTARDSASGAGVKAAQLIADQKVDVLIANNVGPKAFRGLEKAGIKVYSGEQKSLKEIIEDYRADKLEELEGPSNSGHFGLK